jgi:predicted DNA-binding protein
MKGAMVAKSTEREEFRFDSDLAERLRRCAFETRRKKTSIVKEALERYLREQGF